MAKIKRGSNVYYEAGTSLAAGGLIYRAEASIQRDLKTYILRENVEKEKTEISRLLKNSPTKKTMMTE